MIVIKQGLSTLRHKIDAKALHEASIDTIGKALAMLERNAPENIAVGLENQLKKIFFTDPQPLPTGLPLASTALAHHAGKRMASEALQDAMNAVLQENGSALSHYLVELSILARATAPHVPPEDLAQQLQLAVQRHAEDEDIFRVTLH